LLWSKDWSRFGLGSQRASNLNIFLLVMDVNPSTGGKPENGISPTAEKRDLLARLLGRLAHEIRNPLSSLDIHVQLLEEDLGQVPAHTRAQLTGRLGIIRGELSRLENIVRRFMRLASPSTLELELVSMEEVINHVCKLLGPEASARGVEIVTHIAPGLTAVTADGVQLTQVLVNLVINALQAIEEHGRIELCVEQPAESKQTVIEVQDTGPGVPAERLTAVFEPYFTTKAEGSGLGLWIAQQIVAAHGGTLEAGNRPTGGAVFRLRLPMDLELSRHG
jgi:two-component system sensor histidine kinase HydH